MARPDMCDIRALARVVSRRSLGFPSYVRYRLARKCATAFYTLPLESDINRLWTSREYQWMVFFTVCTILWGLGRIFYLGMDGDEIYLRGFSFQFWIDLYDIIFHSKHSGYREGISRITALQHWGNRLVEWWWELMGKYPNLAATLAGMVGATAAGLFGYWAKRPMQRQAIAIALFKTQVEGYEKLIGQLQNRNRYLEEQDTIRAAYEATIIRELRECRQELAKR